MSDLSSLFAAYHDQLVREARRHVPADDAEDVVQGVWASKFTCPPGMEPLRCLRATLRRRIADYRRNRVPEPVEGLEDLLAAYPDDPGDFSGLKDQISRCLEYLKPREARALNLVFIQDLPHAQAGVAMKLSETGMSSLVNRSLSKLKTCLRDKDAACAA